MENINWLAVVLAGVTATVVMNIFLSLYGWLMRKSFRPILLLGTLLAGEVSKKGNLSSSSKSRGLGIILYILAGIAIGFLYAWLWYIGFGQPNYIDTIIYGFFTGLLAIGAWNILLNRYPHPPKVRLMDHFSPILIGHVIFAINFLYIYFALR